MNRNFIHLLRGIGVTTSAGLMALVLCASPVLAQSAAPTPAPKEAGDVAKETAADATDAAKDVAKDTKDVAKDTAKDTQDAAKDTSNVAKDAAKDASKDAKDAVQDTRDAAKDVTKDAIDAAKDTSKDARDAARDTTKDARDTVKGTRDAARDTTRDARDTARDARDTTREPRDTRDTARDPRNTRDAARDPRDARDTRDVRDTRDARETTDTRDVRRDSRTEVNARTNVNARTSFNVNTFRSADMGLWFRSSNNGLIINDVSTSGPIARLGFREGDRIISVNGRRVSRERDFIQYVFADDVRQERVKVIVLRGDREEVVYLEPTVFIEETQVVHHDPLEHFGIVVDDRYDDQLLVWKVIPRTPAYYAGIRAGDVITLFDGQRVTAPQQFVTLVEKVDGNAVQVEVNRNRQARKLDVELSNQDSIREERREIREERREDRRDGVRVDRDGAGVDVNVPRTGVTPRVDVDVNNPGAPRVNVDVNPQSPVAPRGGVLPRIRGR